MRDAHSKICKATNAFAKTQKTYFDRLVKGPAFHMGQHVWLYWPKPRQRQNYCKLDRVWTGPYLILSFKTSVVCRIEHVCTHKRQVVHIDRLTPCRLPITQQKRQADETQNDYGDKDLVGIGDNLNSPSATTRVKRRGRPPKTQRSIIKDSTRVLM